MKSAKLYLFTAVICSKYAFAQDEQGQSSGSTGSAGEQLTQNGPEVIKAATFGTGEEPHIWNWSKKGKDWDSFETCKNGSRQSPIDLSQTTSTEDNEIGISGRNFEKLDMTELKLVNGATTIDLGGGDVTLALADQSKEKFTAKYLQFKSPSDHCFDFKRLDLELQIFLAKEDEDEVSAAISVFFDRSANTDTFKSCPFIQNIHPNVAHLNENEDCSKTTIFDVNLKGVLGGFDFREFYTYEGSLTAPPCTEGIRWVVVPKPRAISEAQVNSFRQNIRSDPRFGNYGEGKEGFNVRGPQELNGREVLYRSSGAFEICAGLLAATASSLFVLTF